MLAIISGLFTILHGLVHLLYFGQSARYLELRPGMAWPDGAWATSRLLGEETTRALAGILLAVAALAFVAGGAGIVARQAWWRPVVAGAAVFSTIVYLIFWDGAFQHLDDKGAIGILINLAILAELFILQWSNIDLLNN